MAHPSSVTDFYTAQQERSLAAVLAARNEWAKLSKPSEFGRIANRLQALLIAAQLGAAKDGAAMVPLALEETGYPEPALAKVNPAAFVGWASDGRALDSLLWQAPQIAENAGGTLARQMTFGQNWLDLAIHQQVIDAGRQASAVAITATANTGWVRYVNPPCCQNCAVLAGKFFRHNTGFQRHYHCDCVHRPTSEREPFGNYVDQIQPDQIHDLTEAQRQALEDGADLSQVVNAYRGATPSQRARMFTTTEGTTRRGWASYVRRAVDAEQGKVTAEAAVSVGRRGAVANYTERRIKSRLTPEKIYKIARNREEAILLLQRNGYIVGDLGSIAKSVRTTTAGLAERQAAADAAKAAAKRYTITGLTDAQADDLLMKLTEAGDWEGAERVGELIDARTKAAAAPKAWKPDPHDAFNPRTYEWFETATEDEQRTFATQLAHRDGFYESQWAHVNGRSAPKRASIPPERQIRADWDTYIESEWVRIEEYTNGQALTREAMAEGRTIRDLLRVNAKTARKWASEETRRYWDDNGRMTYKAFRAGYSGGVESLQDARREFWA